MTKPVLLSSSPLLNVRIPLGRSRFVVAVVALAFSGLAAKAAYIQVIRNDFFQGEGEKRFARTLDLPANRGRILDRHGLILASSVPVPSLWAIPEDVETDAAKLSQLAKILDMPLIELKGLLLNEDKSFVWLKRQVDEALAQRVMALGIKGVYQRKEYRRKYPEGESAAHVVGFTNFDDKGIEGVEQTFNQSLAGRAGSRRVLKDRMGRVIEDMGNGVAPVDGKDLQLSIDSKVQFFAYQKLRDAISQHKAKAGSVVVLDAHSGEVLALANYPSYSPEKRQHVPVAHRRNRALTDTFEPGSTMKPFIAGLALEKGLVKPDSLIQTAPGKITISGSTIGDAHPHGVLTVAEVIQKSSNVGTVKLAMQTQPREMWELYSQVGFGQKPQVPFPGVAPGRLRPHKTWRPIEQATMSYGYGLSASLFQLARSYSVFARDGELVPVTLLKSTDTVAGVRVLSAHNAQQVRKMLLMAAGPGGTAPKAQTLGYSVGGKTGTARKQEGKGYADKKYRSFFVGLAPVDQPRIVVAVMIEEPSTGVYYGGEVAAPVFAETVQQTLRMMGIEPDMRVKPQIVAAVAEEPV